MIGFYRHFKIVVILVGFSQSAFSDGGSSCLHHLLHLNSQIGEVQPAPVYIARRWLEQEQSRVLIQNPKANAPKVVAALNLLRNLNDPDKSAVYLGLLFSQIQSLEASPADYILKNEARVWRKIQSAFLDADSYTKSLISHGLIYEFEKILLLEAREEVERAQKASKVPQSKNVAVNASFKLFSMGRASRVQTIVGLYNTALSEVDAKISALDREIEKHRGALTKCKAMSTCSLNATILMALSHIEQVYLAGLVDAARMATYDFKIRAVEIKSMATALRMNQKEAIENYKRQLALRILTAEAPLNAANLKLVEDQEAFEGAMSAVENLVREGFTLNLGKPRITRNSISRIEVNRAEQLRKWPEQMRIFFAEQNRLLALVKADIDRMRKFAQVLDQEFGRGRAPAESNLGTLSELEREMLLF